MLQTGNVKSARETIESVQKLLPDEALPKLFRADAFCLRDQPASAVNVLQEMLNAFEPEEKPLVIGAFIQNTLLDEVFSFNKYIRPVQIRADLMRVYVKSSNSSIAQTSGDTRDRCSTDSRGSPSSTVKIERIRPKVSLPLRRKTMFQSSAIFAFE